MLLSAMAGLACDHKNTSPPPGAPIFLRSRRLLGEDPLDIETPLSRENKTHTGAEVTPLHFDAEHQPVLLAAAREALSLEEKNEGEKVAASVSDDAADSDWPSADDDARVRLIGHGKKGKAAAAALFAGAATIVALCAARRDIVPF